jgi:exopolysaccharide production protein ExoQ
MKELILSNSLITASIIAVGIIYVCVIFHYAGRDKKLAANLEKIFFGVFLISIVGATGATILPFDKLHPRVLISSETTLPTIAGQVGLYIVGFFLLVSRLNYTTKNSIDTLANLIPKAPFFFSFILLASLSCFWSNAPLVSFKSILVFLETSIFAIYFGKQYSWKEIYRFWRWVNIIIVIICVYQAIREGQNPWAWHHWSQKPFFLCHGSNLSFVVDVCCLFPKATSLVCGIRSLVIDCATERGQWSK